MARDLIPPPAPSWRALQPDGTPNLVELPPERPAPAEAPPPPPPRHLPPSQHRNRFGFLGGALGGVILAAVAIFAIVVTTKDPSSDEGLFKNWSKWQPEEKSMTAGPAEIATHVAPEYKQDDGTQLVTVTGGPLQVQGIPPDDVLVQAQDSIHQLSGHAVMYTLSGLGKRGSILAGKPSNERHRLVRREALELALYSFRYLPNVDMVVALLPPPKPADGEDPDQAAAKNPPQAILYRPGDLKSQLSVPLGATVPAKAPLAKQIPKPEAAMIDSLTLSNLFLADFIQTADRRVHFVLQRPKTG